MAADNAARTRRGYEAMNRGDFDAAAEYFHPDVEWVDPAEWPDRRTVRGPEAIKQIWTQNVEQFGTGFRFELQELEDRGDVLYLAIRLAGSGRGSGVPVEMTWHQVLRMDAAGRVVRLENYLDRDQARRAAGLRTDP